MAKKYISKDGKHIPYKDDKSLTGTARYASINTHLGIEQGRRDDIESIGYVLIYFIKGILPWQNLKGESRQEKYERIMEKKMSLPVEMLCKDLPRQFEMFINSARGTYFDEKPDYQYYRGLLESMIKENGYDREDDYCWMKEVKQRAGK